MNNKVFSRMPYEKEGSKEMMIALKTGVYTDVKDYLIRNKYLVYDFDHVYIYVYNKCNIYCVYLDLYDTITLGC